MMTCIITAMEGTSQDSKREELVYSLKQHPSTQEICQFSVAAAKPLMQATREEEEVYLLHSFRGAGSDAGVGSVPARGL